MSIAKTGKHQSEETRAKISMANINPSVETRAKISAAGRGRVVSPETRVKMSVIKTGHPPTGPKHQTAGTRAKIAAAHKGHKEKTGVQSGSWRGGPGVSTRKAMARRRLLGFVSLNSPFAGCEGHHIDNERVINMPQKLHHGIYHRQSDGRGMAQINAIAYNFLFKQEVEAALEDKREQLV